MDKETMDRIKHEVLMAENEMQDHFTPQQCAAIRRLITIRLAAAFGRFYQLMKDSE